MNDNEVTSRRPARTVALGVLLVSGLALSACATQDAPASSSEKPTVRVALTANIQPSLVPLVFGIDNYAEKLGLDMSVDESVTIFDSHTTGTQTVLGGRAEVLGASVASILTVRERGEDFRIFCPYVSMDDFVLAGANGVTEIDQLFDPETRVAIDSPGGAGAIILNALLMGNGEKRSIQEIPNQQILESSGLRTTAFAAGQVDATVIHEDQFTSAATQVKDAARIATLYEDVEVFVKEAQAAPADWLAENGELAAQYCATTLVAMHELKSDFDLFSDAVAQYVEEPPTEEELRLLFDLIQKYEFWPEDGGLSEESIQFMADVAVASGVLTEAPDLADAVDRETLARAVELAQEHMSE
ncbi:ABC transporter substrate-binding protein [Microbacterium sp. MYb62]|uniref:ABC transporter substrate-binding protein n=1 Tax=Microbacterium sp. MYb62 TaxID=1848690 RepID=UPI000CFDD352|nr:ABC transporter substrate-binding protein [Microbacterium sp. MYb62]PRB18414.1 hypothetical protein CQ042_03765 [Microbacterium sp. MYb62]